MERDIQRCRGRESCVSTTEGMPQSASGAGSKEKAETGSPQSLQSAQPSWHLDFRLSARKLHKNFCCVKPPSLWYTLLQQLQKTTDALAFFRQFGTKSSLIHCRRLQTFKREVKTELGRVGFELKERVITVCSHSYGHFTQIGNQINRGSHLFFSLLTVGGGLQRVDLVWQNVAICILLQENADLETQPGTLSRLSSSRRD